MPRPTVADRLEPVPSTSPPALIDRIAASGAAVLTDDDVRAEAGRDWWPLAIGWAAEGRCPSGRPVVVRPGIDRAGLAPCSPACNEAKVPVTAAAGRSGVCGGLDSRVRRRRPRHDRARPVSVDVDETSLTADVRAGTFGPDLEARARRGRRGLHPRPLAAVDGSLHRRRLARLPGAGQYSTRYGKIEDMVIGLEVVLADGRVVHTEGKAGPRAATGRT